MPNDLPASLQPVPLAALPKPRRTAVEPGTPRALWPTFMRRTLPADQVEAAAPAKAEAASR